MVMQTFLCKYLGMILFVVGEETRTEREVPPLMLGSKFKCKNFLPSASYFHVHGGLLIFVIFFIFKKKNLTLGSKFKSKTFCCQLVIFTFTEVS